MHEKRIRLPDKKEYCRFDSRQPKLFSIHAHCRIYFFTADFMEPSSYLFFDSFWLCICRWYLELRTGQFFKSVFP